MSIEERVTTLEQAFVTLTRLAENMDARMDSTGERVNNLEEKMAALADAQIRTEEALTRLAKANEESLARLAEAQAHTDRRLDALINIISEGRNGKS
jgi:peptidoglycan hydrolase CwlO-like protein